MISWANSFFLISVSCFVRVAPNELHANLLISIIMLGATPLIFFFITHSVSKNHLDI